MLKVGLTGGIGSGKTTVAHIFEAFDIPIYYADIVAKQLMQTNKQLQQAIINTFGKESYSLKGELNRQYISSLVFNNPEQLERLNTLVHPVVIHHAEEWMRQQTSSYVIKEAALIFESGSQKDLDYIIGVFSPQALRIQRIMQRDNIDRNKVLDRMKNQIDEDVKMRLCDMIIQNDNQTPLINQVLAIHKKLLDKSSLQKNKAQ